MDNKQDMPYMYSRVAALIKVGKEKATTSKDIATMLGTNQRNVMEIIEQLIMKYGFLIGANRKGDYKGYYIIKTYDEYKESMRAFNKQIQSMLDRQRAMQANYIKMQENSLQQA